MSKASELLNEHIVRFVSLIEHPSPQMLLEYVPLGGLESLLPFAITEKESMAVLCQSLDALTAVHGHGITHRDIKPANILVQSRYPFHIKLSDFGLAKDSDNLKTRCGTHFYCAPEICQRPLFYTNAADIWSLGVVVLQCAYNLPKFYEEDQGMDWCKKIIRVVNDWDSDPLIDFLSTAMLVLRPERRHSARDCWTEALRLAATSESSTPTPTPNQQQGSENGTESIQFDVDHYLTGLDTEKQKLEDDINVNHYLTGNGTEEQDLETERSLANPPNEAETQIRKSTDTKRKKGSKSSSSRSTPSQRETPRSTRQASSTTRQSKRIRQKETN
ncbi:hypothetical protein G7Y89_g14970 [Cudoniella acicularis]|uniref:Autophagy-related protein 1 n=1 Tax=Cudoniella acicularis TaxID=354080 RepID=A0A8H4QVG1_9HELO|nr:hypothetical protein G7Y89_g14970 [Cudoniella acicularis]